MTLTGSNASAFGIGNSPLWSYHAISVGLDLRDLWNESQSPAIYGEEPEERPGHHKVIYGITNLHSIFTQRHDLFSASSPRRTQLGVRIPT